MKKLFIFPVAIILLFGSCKSTYEIYQVVETTSKNAVPGKKDYIFENNELKINYLIADNFGAFIYTVFNKTNEAIYIDFDKSHFIINGQSFDYYTETETTQSKIVAVSLGSQENKYTYRNNIQDNVITTTKQKSKITSLDNVSIKTKFKKVVEIPPQSYIKIEKFEIIEIPFENCELTKCEENKPASMSFTEDNSPIKFRLYLTYSSKSNFDTVKTLDNYFWISKISNMYENDFYGKMETVNLPKCKDNDPIRTVTQADYPFYNTNSFYLKFEIEK